MHVTLSPEDGEGSQPRRSLILRSFGVFAAQDDVCSKVSVIVETCHVHVARIVAAISGRPVESVTQGREDD